MQKLFNRLGNSNSLALLTYASTCFQCDTAITNSVPDDWASISAMAMYGLGEPDIFRANFMGHSLTFYFDRITDSVKFLGEKSLFSIYPSKEGNGKISNWTLTDNQGISYYFTQKETTTLTLPPFGAVQNNTSTTAWLLTKVVHPTNDSVVLSYSNYGNTYPVSDPSGAMSFKEKTRELSQSNDNYQNEVIQQPNYLTSIESNDVKIDFILGSREDLKGPGSKRLNEIRIRDKQNNLVKKKASFSYDYFNAGLNSCHLSLPDSVSKFYRLRLKLNSITVQDSVSLEPPYQFIIMAELYIKSRLIRIIGVITMEPEMVAVPVLQKA